MKRSLALLVLASGLVGCGGGNPTGPSATAAGPYARSGGSPAGPSATEAGPYALTFLSGETSQPVAAVSVLVDGKLYTTDAGGRITLDHVSSAGTNIDASSAGFLERRTVARSRLLTLWPKVSPTGLDEEFSARVVYGCTEASCSTTGQPLARILNGEVFVVPSPDILNDPEAEQTHELAASLLTAATGGAVTYTVSASPPPEGVVVRTWIDPNDPILLQLGAAGVTRRQVDSRSNITSATVAIRSLSLARRLPLVLHELGHTFGLGHSPHLGDIMWNGPEIYDLTDFSSRERLGIGLMLQRSSGNRFPDSDVGFGAASTAGKTLVLACSHP